MGYDTEDNALKMFPRSVLISGKESYIYFKSV